MQRRDLARGVLAMLAATTPPSRPAHAAAEWTLFTAQPTGSVAAAGLARLAERVAAASQGELVLKLHVPGTLAVNAAGLSAAVAAGTPQLADDPFYSQPVPAGGLVRLPMLVNSAADHQRASLALRPHLKAALGRRELVFLGSVRAAPQSLWTRQPIAGLAGMMGRRVRIGFPEQAELLRRHGGIPVTLALAELPGALQSGAVDGVFAAAAAAAGLQAAAAAAGLQAAAAAAGLQEAAPRFHFAGCLTGYQGQSDSALLASPAAWAALGVKLQAILAAELDDAAAWIAAGRDTEEAAARLHLAGSGTGFADIDPAEELAARLRLAPGWEAWAIARGRETADQLGVLRRALGR